MKGGENMELMVKDLMQNLEKGNRTETHIKNRIAKKSDRQLTNMILSPFFQGETASITYGQYMQSIPFTSTQLGTMQLGTLGNTTGGIEWTK